MREKLSIENPALLTEWDYEKNEDLCPDDYTGGSNKKVWWKCELGHSWYAQINKRFTFGQRCPYCSGNKVWQGYNDIVTTHQHIAAEWDYAKNGDLCPEEFSIGADRKMWWKCKCGHSWQALIYSRKNHGCPACAGNILVIGVNDLLTANPILAAEWDYDKNAPLHPENIAANDNRKMWWICEKEHSWKAVVSSRNSGKGCPYCSNRILLKGFNDLLTVAPELAREWDYERNLPLLPSDFIAGAHKYVWWMCPWGHRWRARISLRRLGHGCPYDAGKLVLAGDNDLQTLRPDISKEWDFKKNKLLLPTEVSVGSNLKVWWTCERVHSF